MARSSRLSAVDREIANLIEAIKAGAGAAVTSIVTTLQALEAEKVKLATDLAALKTGDNVVAIHPRAVERYQRALAELADDLKRANPEEIAILRCLIKTVTVYADALDNSVSIDIKGRIAALCECGRLVVAGEGLEPPTPGL